MTLLEDSNCENSGAKPSLFDMLTSFQNSMDASELDILGFRRFTALRKTSIKMFVFVS